MKSNRLKNETHNILNIKKSNSQSTSGTNSGKKPFLKRYIALILAFLVILLSLTTAYFLDPGLFSGGSTGASSEMRGLKVNNFNLSKVRHDKCSLDTPEFSDRLTKTNLCSFWSDYYNNCPAFVAVKVDSVSNDTENSRQVSDLTVLSQLYSPTGGQPKTMQVSQYYNDDYYTFDQGTSNLLREGGVYILPVIHDDTGGLLVDGDLNVLFEIDNKGKVWSHSDYKDFSMFDGQDAGNLISKIQSLSTNADFMLAISDWEALRFDGLAVATLNTKTSDNNYSFTVNKILSQPADPTFEKAETADFSHVVINYGNAPLESGSQYLFFYRCDNGTINVNSYDISKIQTDGTIKIVSPAQCVGAREMCDLWYYDGRNISDIKDIVSRVKPWLVSFYE